MRDEPTGEERCTPKQAARKRRDKIATWVAIAVGALTILGSALKGSTSAIGYFQSISRSIVAIDAHLLLGAERDASSETLTRLQEIERDVAANTQTADNLKVMWENFLAGRIKPGWFDGTTAKAMNGTPQTNNEPE